MPTQSNDSLLALIQKLGMRIGKAIVDDSSEASITSAVLYADSSGNLGKTTVTASKPVYVDSSSVPQTAAFPFTVPISSGTTTSTTFLSLTGTSTGEANTAMTYPLVLGSSVTTFTKTGFIKVTITDSAGNLTNGDHYIQIGTLS